MMKYKAFILMATGLWFVLSLLSCEKYLEAKSNKLLAVPQQLDDLRSLMDDYLRLNQAAAYAGEVASDDYFITDANMAGVTRESDRRLYSWQPDFVFDPGSNSWQHLYRHVYYGNTVLEQLAHIPKTSGNAEDWNNIAGMAHFHKGIGLLHAAFIWSPAYDAASPSVLGVPIRAGVDFNEATTRPSVAESYFQAIADLKKAAALLPVTQIHVMRPTKVAAYAMLSRAFIAMNAYREAGMYADSALMLNSKLLDYNTLSTSAAAPFPQYGGETIFYWSMTATTALNQARTYIVDELYNQYAAQDLRRAIFFRTNANGTRSFKGNYTGSTSIFAGVAVDEMYLNRAEAYARQGLIDAALSDLNTLLKARWNKNTAYISFKSDNGQAVIEQILIERRKELLMRGLRWVDLKRLNLSGSNITITRSFNQEQWQLKPRDPRYAMAIPEGIVSLTGISQNPR